MRNSPRSPARRALRRGALAPLLAALALPGAALASAPVPTVRVEGVHAVAAEQRGVSETFFGRVGGRQALFKSNAPIRDPLLRMEILKTGNVEGEWLSSRILQRAGFDAADVDVVRVQGREGTHAQVQHLEERLRGRKLVRGVEALPETARVDRAALRRLQVADLLLGNADRHVQNLWFSKDPASGLYRPVPLDHNFSLTTRRLAGGSDDFLTAFERPMTEPAKPGGRPLSKSGRMLLTRNPLYQGALFQVQGAGEYLTEARQLSRSWSDADIEKLVREVPDEAIGSHDKAGRRRELIEGLKRRRDQLVPAMERHLTSQPAYRQAQFRLQGLPPELQRQLPGDLAKRWAFVEALDAKGQFEPDRLRQAMTGAGIPGDSAGRITRVLAGQGVVAAAAARPAAPRSAPQARELHATRKPRGYAQPSFDHLEVADGKARGLDGAAPPPAHAGIQKVAAKASRDLKPTAGERLRIERKGALAGYEAKVVDGEGQVRGRARYHRPLGVTVRTGGRRRPPTPTLRTARSTGLAQRFKARFKPIQFKVKIRGRR